MKRCRMSQPQSLPSNGHHKRAVLLFGGLGAQPWNRDLVIRESRAAGLRLVVAKLASDHSDTMLPEVHRDTGGDVSALVEATEVLPDEVCSVSFELAERLRDRYGEDWYVLPLNDYIAEYAAELSARIGKGCYPAGSAEAVKRKHALRGMWNRLAERPGSSLCPVEFCYVEQRGSGEFEYVESAGFEHLPERTPLIVKPDELSASIEIHSAASKREALSLARHVCDQLGTKWAPIGESIGAAVLPRVIIESAIARSEALHPGAEYSAEYVSYGGEHHLAGVVQKWTGAGFVETGHLFPAESFPPRLGPALSSAVVEMLGQLRVDYGVSHWEFIVTPDERVALVEGHLRAAGGRIMELIERGVGKSPTGALCEALARGRGDFRFEPRRSCGIFWMVPRSPLPQVAEVVVEEELLNMEWNEDLYINEKGIKATPNWSRATDVITRFAHVIATGGSGAEVLGRCREAAGRIRLVGEGGSGSTQLMLACDQ